jgi:hypothetical protein
MLDLQGLKLKSGTSGTTMQFQYSLKSFDLQCLIYLNCRRFDKSGGTGTGKLEGHMYIVVTCDV